MQLCSNIRKKEFSLKQRSKCGCEDGFASNLSEDHLVYVGTIPAGPWYQISGVYCTSCFGILQGSWSKHKHTQLEYLTAMNDRLKNSAHFVMRNGLK